MNAHYLPQFYLKGFLDPLCPLNHEPHLWVYSFADGTWRKRGVGNVAAETDYYGTGGAEGTLSDMESKLAPIVRKVVAQEALTDEDAWGVAAFVGMMLTRVPGLHDNVQHFMNELLRLAHATLYQAVMEDPRRLEVMKEEARQEDGKCDFEGATPEMLDPSKIKFTAKREPAIGFSFGVLRDVADQLIAMGWRFLVAEPPLYFITSDHPFCMLDPTIPREHRAVRGMGGLGNAAIEVTLPFSGSVALFACRQVEGIEYVKANRKQVASMNGRSACHATRFLVAPKCEFPGSEVLAGAKASEDV